MLGQVPIIVVIIVGLTVNLRMALYSATLATHLGAATFWIRALVAYSILDHSFALADTKYQENLEMTLSQKLAFYFGETRLVGAIWIVGTEIGTWLGTRIPDWLALNFAIPIAFIALGAPALRTVPQVSTALKATGLSLAFAEIPYCLGLIVAASVALSLGAELERCLEAR